MGNLLTSEPEIQEFEFDLLSFLLGVPAGIVCGVMISLVIFYCCYRRRKEDKIVREDNPYYRDNTDYGGYAKDRNTYY